METLSDKWGVSKGWVLTIILVITFVILLILGGIFRATFVIFVDSYELGYEYNMQTGETKVLDRTGYFWVTPFKTTINTIDLRPMQIRIEANNRVLNAKLVKFRKEGLTQFVIMHGRDDYDQEMLSSILKSYAYEGAGSDHYSEKYLEEKYLFLDISSGVTDLHSADSILVTIPDTTQVDSSWKNGN